MIIKKTESRTWWWGKNGHTEKVAVGNRWAIFLSVVNIRLSGYGLMWVDPVVADIYRDYVAHKTIANVGVSACYVTPSVKKLLGGKTSILGTEKELEW